MTRDDSKKDEMADHPIIEFRGVSVRFDRQQVLTGIDLAVNSHETLCVIGESGCGKTVLLKLIVGLLQPTEGEVLIEGTSLKTLTEQVNESLVTERLMAMLSAVFGGLATVRAAMGLYGVMAYVVARRTREIGIRMALGANRGSVVWLVMREVLVLAGVGVFIGLGATLALTRLVESQLFEVKPADPVTLALATIGIAAVAILAGYVPARRATGIDPTTALRFE